MILNNPTTMLWGVIASFVVMGLLAVAFAAWLHERDIYVFRIVLRGEEGSDHCDTVRVIRSLDLCYTTRCEKMS